MRRFTLACSLAAWLALGVIEAKAQGPGREGPGGPGGPGGRGFPMSPLMTALDADGDGEISTREIENAPAVLKTLDKDKDGKLSAEELRPAGGRGGPGMGGGGNPAEMITRMMSFDKDGDGKLSKAELPERLQALMDRGDANKDGFLDKAELGKLAERQGARGGAGGPGGPGGGPGRPGGPGRD